ncbi:MAG: SUMF1/EgtB/PvdO family nonheme iron enzyme [Planctomycetota bacterium]
MAISDIDGFSALMGIAIGIGAYLYFTPVMLTVELDGETGFIKCNDAGIIKYGVQRYEYWRKEYKIRSGYETHWDAAGNRILRRRWKKDQIHGLEESWYPSSQIRNRCYWVYGIKNGLEQYWHSNGQLSYEVTWDNGEPVAAPKQWDETGNEIPQPKRETIVLDIGDGIKMELVLIPAGEFNRGSKVGEDNENPARTITISQPFYMGKFEVTKEMFQQVMGNDISRLNGKKIPVTVSWNDAQVFCNKLSDQTQYAISLPTEAQWEYACRAGSAGQWCFGDDKNQLEEYGWYITNSGFRTQSVGMKKPNAFGLYDVHGNVSELCSDLINSENFDPWGDWTFRGNRIGNPAPPPIHGRVVLGNWMFPASRGGGRAQYAELCGFEYTHRFCPSYHDSSIGFRVIAVPKDK